MNKRFLLILLVCVLGFLGILFTTGKKADAPKDSNGNNSSQLTNHVSGAGNKGVTLIEYGDYECPACYQYYPLIEQIRQQYGDDIKFQFRHFPLTEIHQNALAAARAAEAADKQGKFWEMHGKLYETQQEWKANPSPSKYFEDLAAQLGLNVEKFREDFKSSSVNDAIQADRGEARKLGFTGTPTFLINDKKIESPRDIEGFTKLIDEAIKAKNQP